MHDTGNYARCGNCRWYAGERGGGGDCRSQKASALRKHLPDDSRVAFDDWCEEWAPTQATID